MALVYVEYFFPSCFVLEADYGSNVGFYMNLPIGGAAAALITLVRIPERILKPRLTVSVFREVVSDLDLFGFVLFVPPSVMLLLALQLGSSGAQAWDSSVVIGLFCGAGICAILFILWEKRAEDQAMLPGKLLGKRVVWTSCVHASCIITCMMTASIWMPTYFQAVKNNGPTDSGVHVLPSILSQLLAVIATGAAGMSQCRLLRGHVGSPLSVSRMGYYLPWALASGVITTIGNVLVSTFTVSTSTAVWIGYQIVLGAGRGCGMQMVTHSTARVVAQSLTLPGNYCSTKRRTTFPIPDCSSQSRLFPEPQHICCCRYCQHYLRADTHLQNFTLRAVSIASDCT
jgi:hypothetical protein